MDFSLVDFSRVSMRAGRQFEGEFNVTTRRVRPAGLKIEHVVPHEHGHLVRGGWSERADGDFHGAPFTSPLGGEVAAEAGVEVRRLSSSGREAKVWTSNAASRRVTRSARRGASWV